MGQGCEIFGPFGLGMGSIAISSQGLGLSRANV